MGAGVALAFLGLVDVGHALNSAPEAPRSGPQKRSEITVKVAYLQMQGTFDTTEENFVLTSPASLPDLMPLIQMKHPILAPMLPTMQVFIDGVSSSGGMAALADGSVVDLVPRFPGG